MTEAPRPGRRPGRPPSLTRDDLARAALDEGIDTLSMPGVARRLGVGHSTLYRYVHDRDDLVLAALDLAVREFTWPPADLPWRALLTAFADALGTFLARSPGMAEVIRTAPGLPVKITELMAAYAARLRSEGLAERDAVVAIDLVTDLAVAGEITMRSLGKVFDTPRGRRSLREVYRTSWAVDVPVGGREWLNEKLAVLLDGLAARVGEPSAAPVPVVAATPQAEPDRAAVAAAGRALARRDGLTAVTLTSVADRLHTTPVVLRRLVGDRDGLVVAMLDAAAEEITMPPPDPDPRTELNGVAWSVYQVLRTDPWTIVALAVDGLASPLIVPVLHRVVAALTAAGLPEGELSAAIRVLWAQLFGAALEAANTEAAPFIIRMAEAAVPALADTPNGVHDERARLGIGIVIDGLVDRLRSAEGR